MNAYYPPSHSGRMINEWYSCIRPSVRVSVPASGFRVVITYIPRMNFMTHWSNVHPIKTIQDYAEPMFQPGQLNAINGVNGLSHVFRLRSITSKRLKGISWNLHQMFTSLRRYA